MYRREVVLAASVVLLGACGDQPQTPLAPAHAQHPSFMNGGTERHTVVVNPNANGNGVAATIQEALAR
jgi:hypothetical protein